MPIDLAQFSAAFFEEADEHLAALERGLLALERDPRAREELDAVFRAAHSIKGGASTFGFEDVARFTHGMETLLDQLRSGERQLGGALPGLLFRATDALRSLLAAARAGAPRDPASDQVLDELEEAAAVPGAPRPLQPVPAKVHAEAKPREVEIEFTPASRLFLSGADPLLVLRELESMGELLEARCDDARLPPLAALDPESSFLGYRLKLRTARPLQELRDAFCFVEDDARIALREAGGEAPAAPEPAPPGPAALPALRAPGAESSTLRVSVEKVDHLVDLAGEMVITQSMLWQALSDPTPGGLARLREAVAQMERNTRDMQERVMAIRMVPMGGVFGRFHRVVRDLSASLGKQVRLVVEGEEVELDKGVVERIADPLTHLVRNAADHGLELPDERRAAGKPEVGTLRLTARQQGGNVLIEVADDGRGIDPARVLRKAVDRGLVAAGEALTDEQVRALVFLPGFSTKEAVSDLSGRGVGMDVVKRNIEQLGGTVSLASRVGAGTTCTVRLPLTMAILDGLVLRVAARHFVLPLLAIHESFRPRGPEVRQVLGRGELVMLRGEPLPLVRLHEVVGVEPDHRDPREALVTVVDAGGERLALLVDELVGQAQVVVKSLEKNFRRVEGVNGATILGDGTVALMLDVQALARRREAA